MKFKLIKAAFEKSPHVTNQPLVVYIIEVYRSVNNHP